MRAALLVLHRWSGLTIALALVVTGLTGAVLPFQKELREWLAPEIWHVARPSPAAVPRSGLALKAAVERATGGVVSYVQLVPEQDRALSIFVTARPGQPPLAFQQAFVDPYTGAIRARVRFADLDDGRINWIPFLLQFHYSLAAGPWGRLALGLAGLTWAVMSLAGLVLAVPRAGRWTAALRVRRGRGARVLAHDLHRATGVWLLPVMLVFAWSGVAFNLDVVHQPVQRFFGGAGLFNPVTNPQPAQGAPMSDAAALATGQRLMAIAAAGRGFTVIRPEALSWNAHAGVIGFYALTTLDGPVGRGSTSVWFDAVSGEAILFRHPFGATAADGLDKTLRLLHTGELLGWPWRLFISLFGLATAGMAVTGLFIWYRRTRLGRPSAMQRLAVT
jgi:uncharacterized iron-regulated membrane protein